MDIYNYDSRSGEYIGASRADPDPLEEGAWLIPAYATTLKPPKVKAGMAAVFDGKAWALVEDYRGQSGWIDGQPSTIMDLGPRPDCWSDAPPLPTLDEVRSTKNAEINADRDQRIAAGVAWRGIVYDSDDKAQLRITGAVMQMSLAEAAGQTPPSVDWVAMDNSVHTLDMAALVGLGQAISGRLSACVLAANAHKAALEALSGAEAILAYDFSGGWPQ